ncbi:hypothetical protein [Amycolatopsis sulphurea]|uniref:hypothetical protein n=1 Tax=Amycolatopsis sulphurea TaxID=76022 RepID=UPI000BF69853|nr:hypothetical protein [Amycolatopsis sulphurea]
MPTLLSGHLSPDTLAVPRERMLLVTAEEPQLGSPGPGAGRRPEHARRHDNEPVVLDHTSRTTGPPELVVHTTATTVGRLEAHRGTPDRPAPNCWPPAPREGLYPAGLSEADLSAVRDLVRDPGFHACSPVFSPIQGQRP